MPSPQHEMVCKRDPAGGLYWTARGACEDFWRAGAGMGVVLDGGGAPGDDDDDERLAGPMGFAGLFQRRDWRRCAGATSG